MKIEDRVSNYMTLLNSATDKSAAKPVDASGTQPSAEMPPVAVDISATAVQLAEEEARRERLNIIRQQLAEGSYNISGKDVANKILNILKG
jgi:anti-sigma28 factor (negative regulator of flagellin synthesis)